MYAADGKEGTNPSLPPKLEQDSRARSSPPVLLRFCAEKVVCRRFENHYFRLAALASLLGKAPFLCMFRSHPERPNPLASMLAQTLLNLGTDRQTGPRKRTTAMLTHFSIFFWLSGGYIWND